MEASLKVSEEKFSKAFQNCPSAIQLTAIDGRILEVNAGFTRLTGYTAEEVRGRTSLGLKIWENPADRDRFLAGLRTRRVTNSRRGSAPEPENRSPAWSSGN